jgi:ribosomal protein L11 methyltransferase
VLLAGLRQTLEPAVRSAGRAAGFRLAARRTNGEWSILWLRRRPD